MLATTVFAVAAVAQVPNEKLPEFIATGAAVTFNEICLKVYTDYPRANDWMKEHAAQENTTASADPYREEKSDRVFLVGSSLASYVVSFGDLNRCSVYSSPADKGTVERLLDEMMSGLAADWKTKFVQRESYTKERQQVVVHEADIPGTDKPILIIQVVYIAMRTEPIRS